MAFKSRKTQNVLNHENIYTHRRNVIDISSTFLLLTSCIIPVTLHRKRIGCPSNLEQVVALDNCSIV